jgi:hypothetical protein
MRRYEALQSTAASPVIPQGGAKRSACRRRARQAQFGTRTFFDMEAPPPNLRDLTHSARTAVAGEQTLSAPAVPDLSRCSSRIPALLYPPLRHPKRTLLDGCPATPDNSLANKTGQVHLLPTESRMQAGMDACNVESPCCASGARCARTRLIEYARFVG